MTRRNWTRDELLVVFNLYCKLPFGQMHRSNPRVRELAGLLNRTASAVAMKLVNFASLDPLHQKRGVSGLKNVSQSDAAIWEQFHNNWSELGPESEQAYRRLRNEDVAAVEVEEPRIVDTQRERTVRVRLGQAFFRDVVLASYHSRCCICDLPDSRLLVASHIIPWAQREDLRVNPRNGVCLCALHDRAFDRGLIAVDPGLTVLVSPQLRQRLPHPIVERMFAAFEGRPIHEPEKFAPERAFFLHHQQHIFLSA